MQASMANEINNDRNPSNKRAYVAEDENADYGEGPSRPTRTRKATIYDEWKTLLEDPAYVNSFEGLRLDIISKKVAVSNLFLISPERSFVVWCGKNVACRPSLPTDLFTLFKTNWL